MAYLIEDNRILRAQLHGRRVRLTDADRCRLARAGLRVGRRLLRQVAMIVTPDTILRWHRLLIARKWTYANRRRGRTGVLPEIRRLVVHMAAENPTWGYTRIRGRIEECGASGRPIDHRSDPESAWDPAGTAAADLMADVFARTLGRNRGRGFLHDGSVDLAGLGDVLHRLRD